MICKRLCFRLGLISLVTSIALIGCTPEHTAQSSQQFSRSLGLSNHYEIQRWHNRAIARESTILVASNSSDVVDTNLLQETVANTFATGFSRVGGASINGISRAKALREARTQGFGFLLYIDRIETAQAPEREESDSEGEQDDETTEVKYSGMHIDMILIDVLSGRTVDKFVILAKPAYVKLFGDDINDLLSKPLMELVDDLTGA